MSASVAVPAGKDSKLVQAIVVGTLFIFVFHLLEIWVIYTLIFKVPYAIVVQYIASGLLGLAAFEGGMGSALLGTFFHLIISTVISAVFIMAAQRLSFVRRNLIVSGIVYGLIVWFVMNMVVTPLSATPPPDPTPMWVLIEAVISHIVAVGLLLAFLAKRALGDE